jgi:hypothetical protein
MCKPPEGIVPKRNIVPQTGPSIPRDILSVFGDAPVLSTENADIYSDLLRQFTQVIKPKNMIEWMWVRDIADLSWEILRLRRIKARLIEIERQASLETIEKAEEPSILRRPFPPTEVEARHQKRRKLELNTEIGSARAFRAAISDYERVDRLLASAESRRNQVLREMDRYREALAHLMRDASDQIIDAEYQETASAAE